MATYRRLYRSRADRKVLGICGGLGEFFEVDPVLFRLAWILVVFCSAVAPGLLAYLIAGFIIPQEPEVVMPAGTPEHV